MLDSPDLAAVLALAAELRRLPPPYVEARCGHPVYERLRRGAADLPTYATLAGLTGQIGDPAAIPIVLDPEMPVDEVHLLDAAGGRTVVRCPTRWVYVGVRGRHSRSSFVDVM